MAWGPGARDYFRAGTFALPSDDDLKCGCVACRYECRGKRRLVDRGSASFPCARGGCLQSSLLGNFGIGMVRRGAVWAGFLPGDLSCAAELRRGVPLRKWVDCIDGPNGSLSFDPDFCAPATAPFGSRGSRCAWNCSACRLPVHCLGPWFHDLLLSLELTARLAAASWCVVPVRRALVGREHISGLHFRLMHACRAVAPLMAFGATWNGDTWVQ